MSNLNYILFNSMLQVISNSYINVNVVLLSFHDFIGIISILRRKISKKREKNHLFSLGFKLLHVAKII